MLPEAMRKFLIEGVAGPVERPQLRAGSAETGRAAQRELSDPAPPRPRLGNLVRILRVEKCVDTAHIGDVRSEARLRGPAGGAEDIAGSDPVLIIEIGPIVGA